MNKLLTIIFSAYQSHKPLNKIIKKLPRNYKILVIENSLDNKLKKQLEKKYRNVEVIIPKKNLGLAASYNLGIKKSKTEYVFLNNPDLNIQNSAIKKLIDCATKLKNFGIISPTYQNEKNFKNYEIFKPKKINTTRIFKKYDIREVDTIDNCFLVKKKYIKKIRFDENFFLYFETIDFCKKIQNSRKKLLICNKIKYHHYGSSSVSLKFNKIVKLTRAFHYNWSKFYYLKKNFNYFFALKKITPNLIKSLKKIFLGILKLDKEIFTLSLVELLGILCSIFYFKSFYRPKM